jgi:hypothetical protein
MRVERRHQVRREPCTRRARQREAGRDERKPRGIGAGLFAGRHTVRRGRRSAWGRQMREDEDARHHRRHRQQAREHQDCGAPADAIDEKCGEREEHGARGAPENRHAGERAQLLRRIVEGARHDDERGLVQRRRHAQPQPGPDGIERQHAARQERPDEQEYGRGGSAPLHD